MGGYGETALVRGLGFLAEKQAAIANNLANVDTTSFKRRVATAQPGETSFHSLLEQQLPTVEYHERADLARGMLRDTGNRLDIAIDGPQWLRVQNRAGATFYTRNGQLQVDAQGQVVTRSGHTVLDANGAPITINTADAAAGNLTISPSGQIGDPKTGTIYGTLGLFTLPRPEALVPTGHGLYVDPEGQPATHVPGGVQQGFLEGSNVDSLQELVQMIAVERSFTATQKALTGLGRMEENLVNNILR